MNRILVASGQNGHKYVPFKCEYVRNIALSPLCGLYVLLFHIIIKMNDLPL